MTSASRSLRSASRAALQEARELLRRLRDHGADEGSHHVTQERVRRDLELEVVAGPAGDLRGDPQGLEADVRLGVGEHVDGLRHEPSRRHGVRAVLEHGLGERGQRAALHERLPRLLGGRGDLAHLDEHGREVGEPPGCPTGVIPPLERRRELDRAQHQLARAAERLT